MKSTNMRQKICKYVYRHILHSTNTHYTHEVLARLVCPQHKDQNAKLMFEQCQRNLFDSKIILFSKSDDKF